MRDLINQSSGERFQSFLKLAVAAGPLLGLIGTVIGMIMTFQSITESGSSVRRTAGGNSEKNGPTHCQLPLQLVTLL